MTIDHSLRAISRTTKRTLADVLEHFNERAAIREYDGGMSRAEAERAALDDVRRKA